MAKKDKEATDGLESVENVLSKTEQYIEDNQKSLSIIIVAIIIIVGGYLAYQRFYVAPKEIEAQKEMFVAEQYFAKDSFNIALNGDGQYPGFLDIINDYSVTKSGMLAQYYAGISYLRLAQYEQAIEYLKDFDAEDKLLAPIAKGAIGDAYLELGNDNEAISYYKKASEISENDFTTPIYLMKVALIHEKLNDYTKASAIYQTVIEKYNKSTEARKAEKYLTRAKLILEKK